MTPPLATVTEIERRMTPSDYEREREQIRVSHGDTGAQAAALREQLLARLFFRSGWTQEELAKKERCSRQNIARRMRFGRFLGFAPSGSIAPDLNERRFREYWERTDKNETNERIRFRAVEHLLDTEKTHRRPIRAGIGRKVAEQFADGKWHDVETIAKHVGDTVESLDDVFENMKAKGTNGIGQCVTRRRGKTIQYRLTKAGRVIDLAVLMTELQPLLDDLKEQGRRNMVTISPSTVGYCASKIEKIIGELAKGTADD